MYYVSGLVRSSFVDITDSRDDGRVFLNPITLVDIYDYIQVKVNFFALNIVTLL